MKILFLLAMVLLAANSTYAQTKWVQDKFEIGAWRMPSNTFVTDEVYEQMAAAGFTVATSFRHKQGEDVETNKKLLDLFHKHGMRLILADSRITIQPPTEEDKRAMDAMIADYKDHPALYGYYVKDEPKPMEYRRLAQTHTYLRKQDPGHLPYINLFPNYGGPHQLQFEDYDGYVNGFVRAVDPLMLSYDHYPFRKKDDRDNWFANLEVIRRDSLKLGVPMWVIVQALEDATRYRRPTLNQMYWQVSSSLAYGARSIWYFPYWSAGEPEKPEDWHYLGVVMPDGTPGPQYAAACEINPKLKALGPLFMELNSVSVMHLGDTPLRANGFEPDDLLAEASGDQIVIGRFADKKGKPVLMVMNRDYDNPGDASISLKKAKGVEELGRLGPGEPLSGVDWDSSAKTFSVNLAPGEVRIIRVRL